MSIPLSTKQFQQKNKSIRTMPVRKVSTDRLVATQNNFDPVKVAEIAEKDPATFDKVALVGKRDDGRYGVMDGHHRVAGAILRGDKTVSVRICR